MNEWCTYNLGGKDLTYHRHTQASDFRKVTVFVDVLRKEKVPEGDISIMKITTTLLVICLLTVKSAVQTPLPNRSLWWQCEFVCEEPYKPVCAVDETGVMKSFPNRCKFELANCMSIRLNCACHRNPDVARWCQKNPNKSHWYKKDVT